MSEEKQIEFQFDWESLGQEAEELDTVVVERPDDSVRVRSLKDRLARLTLEGYLPLLLLAAVAQVMASRDASLLGFGTSLVFAPLSVLLFKPLVRSKYGIRLYRIVMVMPLMLVACSCYSAAARLTEHRMSTGQVHLEYVALAWQMSLENLLSSSSVLVLLISTILVIFLVEKTHQRFPWIQLSWKQGLAEWSVLVVQVLILLGALYPAYSSVRFSKAENTWIENSEALKKNRPYATLPVDSEDRTWRDLHDELKVELAIHKQETATGDSWWSPEDVKAATEEMPRVRPQDSPPTSLAEAEACQNYLGWLSDVNLEDRLRPNLDRFEVLYTIRPTSHTGDFTWLYEMVLSELNEVTEVGELASYLIQVRALRENLGDPWEGVCLRAHDLLRVDMDELTGGDEIGWKVEKDLVRPDKFVRGWSYQANPTPQPLKIGGWEWEHSPTQLGVTLQSRRLLKQWVLLEAEIAALPWEKKMKRLKVERDSLSLTGTVEDTFWGHLLDWEFVPNEVVALKQAELLILLKLYQSEHGEFPSKLTQLSSQIDFAGELSEAFSWDPTTHTLKALSTDQSLVVKNQ